MAIAEIFLSAFITVLFEKLASSDLIRLAKSAGIDSELIKWNNTLSQVQAVLVDAGQKHIRDSAIQLWLNKLQHLAYDIDDVLDDLSTEAMRRQSKQQPHACTSKVLKFIPTKFRALTYGRKMSTKLDEITSKLQALIEEKNILGLISNVERSDTTSRPRSEETSLVDVSEIVGREADKDVLLKKLVENDTCDQKFSIVSIVGLGGIGKTTLARLLYNEKKVKDHFEVTSWICVSDEFDIFNISKAIFKDVGGDDRKFETLNQLQVALSEKLSNKKFLIVLDDVWNEDYKEWELLQRPFVKGATGSKVIVTTRKTMVASVMDSIEAYPLQILSDDEALCLLAQHALGKPNFDSDPRLKLHGESIVHKCGRLPLALETLGRVLRRKTSEEEWKELLNNDIWNVQNEKKILPALRLSYYDLPPHLKQMFAYCCLFPKDYLFRKDELVLLWMAEGFLRRSNGSKSLERLGRDCFEELESRSFFQHLNIHKSHYTMHDLISDLAMSVAGEFFFILDDKTDLHDVNESLEKFHHFSFIHQQYGVYRKFKALERARRLRTFIAMSVTGRSYWEEFFLSNKVLVELLPQLLFLRVLNLANYSISEVPQSICGLKHLRYINFSHNEITCLPEQIGDLYNLQSLLLSGCHKLSSLPESCGKLINLRHLDISDTPKLNETPVYIGGLTSLQTLSKVIIGGASGFKISVLKDLLHLQGQLSIEGLHKVIDATHAKEAKLHQKKDLCDLDLAWRMLFDDTRNGIMEYEVLESLRPSEQMKSLKISYYMGTKFPSWIGNPSFVCLTELTLRGCRSCTSVPTLGHLPLLKKLFLESMDGLKRIGPDLLGYANCCNGIAFPVLEVLSFGDMQGWEEWPTCDADKDGIVGLFPCLRDIYIKNCPKLEVVTVDFIPSLQVLDVSGCSVAALRSMVFVSSSVIRLTMENIKGLTQLQSEVLEHLKAVKYLNIYLCDELTYLFELGAEACDILVSLQTLKVCVCVNLVSLVERKVNLVFSGMGCVREVEIRSCPKLEGYDCPNSIEKLYIDDCDSVTSFTLPPIVSLQTLTVSNCANLLSLVGENVIREVYIRNCPKLVSYRCPNNIEKLKIDYCNSMTSSTFPPQDDLPSTLKDLSLYCCDNLEVNWVFNNFLSSLGTLELWYILNVRLLPEGCLVHLTKLSITGCENLESIPEKGFGFLPLLCLRDLDIWDCKNIKSIPQEHLPSLTSLEHMRIADCPSMEDSFPSGLWPPSLRSLEIGLNKGMSDWGIQHFPSSLVDLVLNGNNSGVVRFAEKAEEEEEGVMKRNSSNTSLSSFLLPSSLKVLRIRYFDELESVRKGMEHLTYLQILEIWVCQKLRDLPETLLPSLSCLRLYYTSEELKKKCRRRKGKYWPIISQIPDLKVGIY